MRILMNLELVNGTSFSRDDLAVLPKYLENHPSKLQDPPRYKYECSLQQYVGTDLCQWMIHRTKSKYRFWFAIGPLMKAEPESNEH